MRCVECGEDHRECDRNLLMGMKMVAYQSALEHLGPEYREVLDMLDHSIDVLGLEEALEARVSIENRVSEYERSILEMYLARKTLIDGAMEQLREGYEEE